MSSPFLREETNIRIAKARDVYTSDKDFQSYLKLSEVLVPRYLAMLQIDATDQCDWSKDRFGPRTSLLHLKSMLITIREDFEQSITKKHRWMGYVQAFLIVYGFTAVDREREMTRDVFKGD